MAVDAYFNIYLPLVPKLNVKFCSDSNLASSPYKWPLLLLNWLGGSLFAVKLLTLNCYRMVRQDSCAPTCTHTCGSLQALDWDWQAVSQGWFGWGRQIPNLSFEGYSPSFVFYMDTKLLLLGSYWVVSDPKYKLLWDRGYLGLPVILCTFCCWLGGCLPQATNLCSQAGMGTIRWICLKQIIIFCLIFQLKQWTDPLCGHTESWQSWWEDCTTGAFVWRDLWRSALQPLALTSWAVPNTQ